MAWLSSIETNTEALYLVGDVFDFWWEYRYTIPKYGTRFLGKIAQMTDSGIPVYVFTGNHDVWLGSYLEQELGVKVIREPIEQTLGGKRFYIGHGDGLGPGDYSYKFIKKLFVNPFLQWCFSRLHPNLAFWLATSWSKRSRMHSQESDVYLGNDREWLYQYCKAQLILDPQIDFFVFGHRHLPLDVEIECSLARYLNCGDWFKHCSYVEFDGNDCVLKRYQP